MVGVANSILLVYYVYFPDKQQGRKEGNTFYKNMQENYVDLALKCRKMQIAFKFMNYIHINENVWSKYKRIKQYFIERGII